MRIISDIKGLNLSFGFEENGINRNITNLKQNFANLNSNIKKTDVTFKSAERSASEYKAEQTKLIQASKLLAKNLDDLESEMKQLDLSTAKGKKKHSQLIKEFNKEAIVAQGLQNRIDELGDEYTELAFKATVAGKAMRGLRGINTVMDGVHAQVGQIAERFRNLGEIGTMVIRGMLMTNLSALVPVAGAAVSAIAGIGGALVALTGGAIGMAGAFGVAGVGVMTFAGMAKTALKMVEDGTMQSSSALTTYKTSLAGIKTQWQGLVQANATSIFTTMSNGINIARIALTKLTPFINKTSTIIASMSGRMRDWVNSSKNASQFFKILNNIGPPIMKTLLNAVMSFVNGTTALFNKLSPLFLWAAQGFANMAKSFDNWANSVQGSQAIANFVNYTKTNLPVVGSIFGNLFSGIISLFQAFAPHSEAVLQGMKGVTQSFKDWAAQLANTQGFKDFIAYLNENGPKVWNILKNIGSIIVSVVQGMAPLGQMLINIIGPFTSWVAQMLSAHGWLRRIVGALSMVVGAIMLSIPIFGTLKGIFMAVTTSAMRQALAMKLMGVATKVWAGITKVAALAARGLGLAIRFMTGPIGLVILAITALVAGIIYLWKTNKTFRTIVIATWNAIKAAAIAIFGAIKNFIVGAWNSIKYWSIKIWNGIKNAVMTIIRLYVAGIRLYINTIRKIIVTVFNFIKYWSIKIWNGIKNGVVKVVRLLQIGIKFYINLVRKIITTVFNFIKTWAVKIWNGIKNGIVRIVRTLYNNVRNNFNFLKNAVVKIISTLRGWLTKAWNFIRSKAVGIIRNMSAVARGIFNGLKNGIVKIISVLRGWLIKAWSFIRNKVVAFARSLWNGVRNIFNSLSKGTRNIFNAVRSFLYGLWQKVRNKIVAIALSLWNGVKSKFNALSKGTKNIFNGVRNYLVDKWNNIKNKVVDMANAIKSKVTGAFGKMRDSLKKIIGKITGFFGDMMKGVESGLNSLIKGINKVGSMLGMGKEMIKPVKLSTGTEGGASSGASSVVSNGAINRPTLATVNDRGPGNGSGINGHQELIQKKNGSVFAPQGRDVTVALDKGDRVINGRTTAKLQKTGQIPKFSKGTGKKKKNFWEKSADAVGGTWDGAKHGISKGMQKTGEALTSAGKFSKDWITKNIGDVMDWVKKPGKLLNKILGGMGMGMKSFGIEKGNVPYDLMGGMFKKLKSAATDLIKSWFEEADGGEGDAGWLLKHDIWQKFGKYSGGLGFNGGSHYGVDFGMMPGTNVKAVAGGKVSRVWNDYGGGKSMEVDIGGGLTNWYMHLSKQLKKKGDKVGVGDLIAKSGNTG